MKIAPWLVCFEYFICEQHGHTSPVLPSEPSEKCIHHVTNETRMSVGFDGKMGEKIVNTIGKFG